MRLLSFLSFGFLAGLIVLIYDMKFQTRRLEDQASKLERAISEEKDNVALMRAEWSHVTRPDRIETLARDMLKLQPARPEQLIADSDFMNALARRPMPQSQERRDRARRDEIGALIRGGQEDVRGRPSE